MDSTNPSPDDPYERGKRAGRRLGAYAALGTARTAVRTAGPRRVAEILNGLVSIEDLARVLRQLEDASDQAGQ